MSDSESTQFPKMGDSIIDSVVNISGAPSRYTTPVGRKNTASGGATGSKANKGKNVISHANGPACTIVAKISYPNAEGANQTMRNIRRVRGGPGFYGARAEAANSGGV